ncbi:MAG: hypothetical protein K2Q12_10900 [Rickettsiales bacterium]|jgi:hypothetical protein|nr:hypothetical protein [Rickettsiales bacterium]
MENGKNIKRFSVIEGGQSPRAELQAGDDERVTCHVCMRFEGVDTIEFIPVHTKVMRKDNELKPVITRMLCVSCLQKGRKTYIT